MKVLIAGDYSPCERVAALIEQNNSKSTFEQVIPFIDDADYAIVNFESTLAPIDGRPITKCGPNLSTTEKAVHVLKECGFDCVTLANNHVFDYGEVGLQALVECIKNDELDFVGAGTNLTESKRVLYKKIKSIEEGRIVEQCLAIVNVCEHEFSIADYDIAGAAPIDPIANYYQITEARKNADYVLVICHGGHEHFQLPSARMKQLYRTFVEWGADAVVNHHQHCYSGYEIYHSKPIFYGLGNFCFDQTKTRHAIWNEGYFVVLDFDSKTKNIGFQTVGYSQCNECPMVRINNQEAENLRYESIERLNRIIADDTLLRLEWDKWADERASGLLVRFAPFTNRVCRFLTKKKILPSFLGKYRTALLLNIIECESHRDIVLYALKKRLK